MTGRRRQKDELSAWLALERLGSQETPAIRQARAELEQRLWPDPPTPTRPKLYRIK